MTLRSRLRTAAVVAAMLLASVGGGWLGVRLGHAASEPNVERVAVAAPEALAGPPADAVRSPGGFTGFGGAPALRGEVQRSGTVQRSDAGAVVIGTAESNVTVRYTSPERLFRIVPAGSPLKAGDLVQVRVKDGAATSLLRLPANLEQGSNRPR